MVTATTRARLLPDRVAKLEAAIYVIGAGATVVGFVATLVLAPSSAPPSALLGRGLGVVAGLVVAVVALARRRRPDLMNVLALGGAATAAAAAIGVPLLDHEATRGGSFLAAIVLFAAAVRRCPPQVATASGALGVVTFAADAIARDPWISGNLPGDTVGDAVGWVVALLIGLLLRTRDGSRRVEALAHVRASERLLVAREMHDLVARHVTGMVVRAQALTVVAPDLPAPARSALDDIEASGGEALAAMRRMVGVLRDVGTDGDLARLDDLPSAAVDVESAVRGAVDEAGPAGADVRVTVDDTARTGAAPARELLTTVHRLVAEGLTNVARHAPAATAVDVAVTRDGGDLVLTVTNDGAGGAARRGLQRGGFGLVGMGERVRALGGTLDGGRDGPDRWVLAARVPVREAVGS